MRRLLIANRGEIARRIIRTARAMGIGTVAVYSDADRDAPYVAEAGRAVRLGAAPAAESYLNIPAILAAARAAEADAVHPGYGFLSEHATFAQACAGHGLTFVGPPAAVLARAGSKPAARAAAQAAGVPVVPGEAPASQSRHDLEAAARRVGFPLLLKAADGGGGKGMRVVRTEAGLPDAIGAAQREAAHAFGSDALYVERLIERPRHVEVQIFGDTHGRVVHLFERDCTLQRRHQKVIEESPAPTLTPAVRGALLEAALTVARAVGYINAGTVEFLVEGRGDAARFYFLELNARLQVEHPVTEAVTGLDLVRLQIEIAQGAPLAIAQRDVTCRGHAMECRVYAEDSRRLLPQSGRVVHYREPEAAGVRIDSGIAAGQIVGVHYDPMMAKVIAHAGTRSEAHATLLGAIQAYEILGVAHNLGFLKRVLETEEVRTAETWTTFIEERLADLTAAPSAETVRAAAAMAAVLEDPRRVSSEAAHAASGAAIDPWDTLGTVAW